MDDSRNDRIRERAHDLWEREGRPNGRDREHWEQAQREIETEGDDSMPAESHDSRAAHAQIAPQGGIATNVQPGGTTPGGGPAAGERTLEPLASSITDGNGTSGKAPRGVRKAKEKDAGT